MRKKEREGEVDRPGFVLGSSQGLLITFSCTTLWWLPYKVLSWAEDQQLADQLLLIPASRFDSDSVKLYFINWKEHTKSNC